VLKPIWEVIADIEWETTNLPDIIPETDKNTKKEYEYCELDSEMEKADPSGFVMSNYQGVQSNSVTSKTSVDIDD